MYSMKPRIATPNPWVHTSKPAGRAANFPHSQARLARESGAMFPRALGESGTSAGRLRLRGPGACIAIGFAVISLAAGISACGGGQRQDATGPSGNFPVQVTKAKFANHQKLAATNYLQLAIRNAGNQTLPDLTVTINTVGQGQPPDQKSPAYSTGSGQGSFNVRVDEPHLAFPFRPVWILEGDSPKVIKPGQPLRQLSKTPTSAAASAATDTFQFGPVKPEESKYVVWRVTPVQAGTYTVHYEVSASVTGTAKAVTPDGSPVRGEFVATISAKPPQSCVTGSGKVTTNCGPAAGG